jgi:hypothetical protein
MLELLDRVDGPVLIAGITECRTAQRLIAQGDAELVDGWISSQGGSGHIRRLLPDVMTVIFDRCL